MVEIILNKLTNKSDECTLNDNNDFFTQFNISDTTTLSANTNLHCSTQESSYTVDIISSKFIDTIEGTSLEGQHLSGKKLTVIGKINLTTTFYSNKNRRVIYCLKKSIPFSTFIVVPKDIDPNKPIILLYCIEDITSVLISTNKLYTSITMLLKYEAKPVS